MRLRQGRADDVTIYSDDPAAVARRWQAGGATFLHVIDLDGAFQGRPVQLDVISAIRAALEIPFEVGGGLRTDDDIRRLLDLGVDRVILGTRACENTAELAQLVARFGNRLAVGIDARDGMAQTKGWVTTTRVRAVALAAAVADAGVATIIYTDTATDGMLKGPNCDAIRDMCSAAPAAAVIASGGVTSAEDIRRLRGLRAANLKGAIVGKALYDGRVTLAALLKVAAA